MYKSMLQNPSSSRLGKMPDPDPTRLALQSCLEYLDGLDRRIHEEIQETRSCFLKLLDNCQSGVTMGDSGGYENTVKFQAAFDDILDYVIPATFATLRDRFSGLQPAPHSTSSGVTGWLSGSTNTPLGQPPQGLLPGSTSSSASYGPVTQPFIPQPRRSTYSEVFSVIYNMRDIRWLPEDAYPVDQDELQVPADLMEVNVEQATFAGLLEGDIDIEGADGDPEDSTASVCDARAVIEVPKDLSIDDFCVPSKECLDIVPGVVATRVRPRRDGFPRQVFDPKDITCLSSPTAPLNDGCINGCAALLYSQLKVSTVDCAILSTYDLPRIRWNARDDNIWRNTSWTWYWEKNVWILPIHRPSNVGHWVICVIYFQTKELHLFDSLADQEAWERDVKVCSLIFYT
ncbi:hypothetical protein F4604DRAFT_1731273, partial [Suillus subluteus]